MPPLDGDTSADACVVGLGASGLAAVEALCDRGLTVIGVDAGRVANGAAGRNGGLLSAGPELALHAAIERWGAAAVDLHRATLGEIDRLVNLLGPTVVRQIGSIRLADEGISEIEDCERQRAAMRANGFAAEWYDGPLGRGLFLPDDAALNPAVRAIVLATGLAGRARLHEHTRVTSVEAWAVRTEQGVVRAATIVVAIDGRLDVLLPQLSGRVRTARLQMLSTAPVPHRLPCPVHGPYDYAQQLPGGRLFVGGGRDRFVEAEWTTETDPSTGVQAYLDTLARRLADGPVRVTHRWAASVGFTPDDRPLCLPVDDGVIAVGGYNGSGNLVGPVAARAAVALALDGTEPPPYLASR